MFKEERKMVQKMKNYEEKKVKYSLLRRLESVKTKAAAYVDNQTKG